MADAWGGSWGSSWGVSWGFTTPPTPGDTARRAGGFLPKKTKQVVVFQNEIDHGKKAKEDAELRNAIISAFGRDIPTEGIETANEIRKIAAPVYQQGIPVIDLQKLREISGTIERIKQLAAQVAIAQETQRLAIEAALELQRQLDDDDEAIAILLH